MNNSYSEPEFSIPDSTPRSSKTEFVVAGLRIYVYGLEELKLMHWSNNEIAVLYLAHGRTLTYLNMEGFAHEILHRYRNDRRPRKTNLIAVTLDMPNHGDREISREANLSWDSGNETHGPDMLSLISASASDFGILFDYLPSYIPGRFKKFYNIMAGVSLGGHVAWRVSKSVGANKIHGIVPIIASPNLTGLMLTRLGVDASILKLTYRDLYTLSYKDLATVLTEEQQRRWPESLSKIVQETDRTIEEDFPKDIPMLIQNGEQDLLVPSEFATQWAQHTNPAPCKKIECFVQKNTGHTCTKEMVANTADWLVRLFMI